MRYQSSFYGPLIGLFFLIALTWAQNDCVFRNATSDKPVQTSDKLICNINENAKKGNVVSCRDDIIVDHLGTISINEKTFDVKVSPNTNNLQVLVNSNLTEILQKDDPGLIHIVSQMVTCNPGKRSLQVTILINAENNHDPTFDQQDYNYQVVETAQEDHLINPTPIVVVDRDYRESNVSDVVVTITAGNENNTFKMVIEAGKTSVPTYKVNLLLNRTRGLPYKKEGYQLTLMAKDKGTPPRSSTAQVMINVIDVDDQDPIFEHPVYTSHLYITEKENKKLFISNTAENEGNEFSNEFPLTLLPNKLFAYDQDVGINATILYELIKESGTVAEYFLLGKKDPVLDLIKIDGNLLKKGSISLLVKAYQEDNLKRQAFAMVNVQITAKPYEGQPIFTQEVELLRSQPENVGFYNIQSSGENTKYEIKGLDSERLKLVGNAIQLKEKLTKEIQKLEIEIQSTTDNSLVATSSTMKVVFNVVEVKKLQDTLFNRTIHRIDEWSDTAEQEVVFTIKALEGGVTYKLSGGDTDVFSIDEISGEIKLEKKLQKDVYSLKVTGTGGGGTKVDTTEIIVHVVTKKKPKEPLFSREIYVIDIASDTLDKSKIFEPNTTDPNVTISIEKTDPEDAITVFQMDSNYRYIILNGTLDPTVGKYTIHLLGTIDEPGKEDNGTSKVDLHVIDVTRPTSSLFTKSQYGVDVRECTEPGKEIFTINTTKKDVKMEIIGGDTNRFEVTAAGRVRLLEKLDLQTAEYELEIRGKISSTNETDKTKVLFSVTKCDLGKVYFEKCVYSAKIKENTATGHVLANFNKENGIYIIKSGDNEQAFDVQKGELILKKDARNLEKESYYIVLSATAKDEVSTFPAADVTSEEAVVMVLFERRPQFLHPSPLVKVFTPSAPLSDYVFQINVKQSSRQASFLLSGDLKSFAINSENGLVYPVTDITKIEGFHTVLQVTAQYNKELKDTLDIHIFRLKRTETLMMTSSKSLDHTNVENIMTKLSDVSKCEIFPLQYQAVDQKQKTKLVKRSPKTFYSENEDSKLALVVAALKENKPLSLQQFKEFVDEEKLTEEIGFYKIDELPELENSSTEVTVTKTEKEASNGGLVAAVAILGTMVSLTVLAFVGVLIYRRYWPMLNKSSKESEANEESVLKRWKPPTPPQRRTGRITPETSLGVVNGGLTNDADHLYIDLVPDHVYTDTLSLEIKNGEIPGQEQPAEIKVMEVAISGQTTDDVTEESTSDEPVRTGVTQEREARKSVVTFSEQADIIP